FSILPYTLHGLSALLNAYDLTLRNFCWSVMTLQNRILYSTRIQAFVVLAVVGTLVIAGIITFFSLSDQYSAQQQKTIVKQISQIARGLESQLNRGTGEVQDLGSAQEFSTVAEMHATDLNLFDISGELIYTTQNKIYDLGLTSRFMNARAWLSIGDYSREEYFHTEAIGKL